MRIKYRFDRLLLLALATCAITWSLAGAAIAQPADAKGQPVTTESSAIGDHSVPDPRQVDAVLADLKQERETAEPAASVSNSDTETLALVLSIVAILTALGAVTLTVTRSRGGVVGT